MRLRKLYKDEQETRLYTFDWTAHIGTDTIVDFDVTVTSGLDKVSEGLVDGDRKVSVMLSGGMAGEDYDVVNTITTASGQVLERTGIVAVRQF